MIYCNRVITKGCYSFLLKPIHLGIIGNSKAILQGTLSIEGSLLSAMHTSIRNPVDADESFPLNSRRQTCWLGACIVAFMAVLA